jgi:tetratricopeptide (TPR) repeat protein
MKKSKIPKKAIEKIIDETKDGGSISDETAQEYLDELGYVDPTLSYKGMIRFLLKKNTPESLELMNKLIEKQHSKNHKTISDEDRGQNKLMGKLDPNDAIAYNNRGNAKEKLKDYYGAIADYNKAIELDPNDAAAYVNRGIAKELIGDLNGACSDWKKAANLGHTDSAKWVNEDCN